MNDIVLWLLTALFVTAGLVVTARIVGLTRDDEEDL